MKEYYFKIEKESKYYKEYFDYKDNMKKVNEIVKVVMINHEIESTQYVIGTNGNHFGIMPTKADEKKFELQLKKGTDIRMFKKSSQVFKDVFKGLEKEDLIVLRKPCPYYSLPSSSGGSRVRLFSCDEVLYFSIEYNNHIEINPVEHFTPIKASEFFAVIESMEVPDGQNT